MPGMLERLSVLTPGLFIPWGIAIGLALPLLFLERWIHKHLQGLGLLLTNNAETAVFLYYFVMLPGVIVHEFGHWIMAKVLLVKVKKMRFWPQRKSGDIQLGLVETVRVDPVREALIGLGPVVAGVAVVYLISTLVLDTRAFYATLVTGDLRTIGQGLAALTSTADFWLWLYVLFAVSNAMMPSPADRESWPLVGAGIVGVVVFMFVLDLGGLVAMGLERLTLVAQALSVAFLTAIGVDVVFMVVIALMEAITGRAVGRVVEYK